MSDTASLTHVKLPCPVTDCRFSVVVKVNTLATDVSGFRFEITRQQWDTASHMMLSHTMGTHGQTPGNMPRA